MAKEFVKLSEVAVLKEVTDNATVLVEENGEIYRAPKTQVGGTGGVKTAIIRESTYLEYVEQLSQPKEKAANFSYECINMTFEEAYETLKNGEPLAVMGMFSDELPVCYYGVVAYAGERLTNFPCIQFIFTLPGTDSTMFLYWTADGLSSSLPGGPN